MNFVTTKLETYNLAPQRCSIRDLWTNVDWIRFTKPGQLVNENKAKGCEIALTQATSPLGMRCLVGERLHPEWWSPIWQRLPEGTEERRRRTPQTAWRIFKFDDGEFVCTMRQVWVPLDAFKAESRERIFSLPNVEHRRECISYWSFERLLDVMPHEVLDTDGGYQVLVVKNLTTSQQTWNEAYFLKMVNPSTADIHVEGLDPWDTSVRTVKGALAYRNAGLVPEVIT